MTSSRSHGNELFEDCRRGQTHSVQLWIAQKSKKHRSPLNFLRSGNAMGGVGWLAGVREPSTSHTLLHLTALHGHHELTRLLMQRDAQLATARDRKGCLPLHLAAWNGHEEVIVILLAAEPASVNAVNNARETALHLTTLNGHANAARLLLRHHADARLRNARMETALDIAVRTDNANLCRLLMLNCPELNLMCASDCCTSAPIAAVTLKPLSPPYPLHSAARLGHTDCVEALLEHDFDPNYLGPDGTALHVAIRQGHCPTVQTLLNYGATIDICDSNGQTVSEWLSTRLSSSTQEADDGMGQQSLRECKKLVDEAEHRRRVQRAEQRHHGQTSRAPKGIWKSAVPEPKCKQYNSNTGMLKNMRIPVPPPPVASPRSLSQPISATSTPSKKSPLRGTFSPSSCTYQSLPNEKGLEKMASNDSLPPYQNVQKPTLAYDNAPLATDRQRKWVHNCANGCLLPDSVGDDNKINATMASDKNWHRNGKACSPCAELGLIQLPTVEDLSPCSTLERSPQSNRDYGGILIQATVTSAESACGAPLSAPEELLSASVTPLPSTTLERNNAMEKVISKQLSSDDGNTFILLEMPSCSSSIVTLAPNSSPSSCSLLLSNLSPSSSAASPEHVATLAEECLSPKRDKKSMGLPNVANAQPHHQQQEMLPSSISNCTHGDGAQVPRVRQLVQWMENKESKIVGKAAEVQPVPQRAEAERGENHHKHSPAPAPSGLSTGVVQAVQQRPKVDGEAVHQTLPIDHKQSIVDHTEQWKEIDELLHSLQQDSQLIAHVEEKNSSCFMKNSSKYSVSSMNSTSSPNSCDGANGTACVYQPIARWLRIQVGLSRDQHQTNNGSSAQALAELLYRQGFDTVRFMKGSLNTALMDEIGMPRRVQLQICRFLNESSVLEHIRSADQFEFVSDWLDSLDLLDHLGSFAMANLTCTTDVIAAKLSRGDLEKMNVIQLGHIARITRSLDLAAKHVKKLDRPTNSHSSGSSSPTAYGDSYARETTTTFMLNSNKSEQQNLRMSTQSPLVNITELRMRLQEDKVRFSAHYLGSTEISNVEGTEDCRRALHSAKNRVRQTADVPWVVLEISVSSINIRDINNKLLYRHPIGHIQVVCQDEVDLNCFAYIFQEGERHFCYVFCVLTAIIAKEIIVTLGETFNLAYKIAIQQ